MSATTTSTAPSASAPVVVHGWTEGRARRARMFAGLLAAIAIAAVWTSFQPWYGFATSGSARCDRPAVAPAIAVRTPTSNTTVAGVYASGCISGRGIAQEYAPDAGAGAGAEQALNVLDRQNTTAAPAVLFGAPRTVALVVIFSLVGMAGLWMRNGWFGLAGIVGFYYAHKDLGALQSLMTTGDGGALNQPQPGLRLFGWALVLGWGVLTSATLLMAKHNSEQRHLRKRAALAAGEPAPLGPLDHVAVFLGGKIALAADAATAERRRERHAATAD